jgi:hypothetical protein
MGALLEIKRRADFQPSFNAQYKDLSRHNFDGHNGDERDGHLACF